MLQYVRLLYTAEDERPRPFSISLSHANVSFLRLYPTKMLVNIAITADHTYGRPHPTPKPMSSGNVIIKTVATIATRMKLTPHHQLIIFIILRNITLESYLLINCALKAFSPLISIAPKSSMKANNAGRHKEPLGVEDMLNGSVTRSSVMMEL